MADQQAAGPAYIDREHLAGLISRERETYGQRHAAIPACVRVRRREPARRRADDLDADVARRVPALLARPRAARG